MLSDEGVVYICGEYSSRLRDASAGGGFTGWCTGTRLQGIQYSMRANNSSDYWMQAIAIKLEDKGSMCVSM